MTSTAGIGPELQRYAAIADYFRSILSNLQNWSVELAEELASTGEHPTGAQLAELVRPEVAGLRDRIGQPLVGGGFASVHDYPSDAQWHISWWQGSALDKLLEVDMDVAGDAYSRREYFTRPVQGRVWHITGPYVDLLCTDEYSVTFTVPVIVEDQVVGIVGCDMLVEELEPLVRPLLHAAEPQASIINEHGRALVSAQARVASGFRMLRGWDGTHQAGARVQWNEEASGAATVLPLDGLPLAIVVPD